MNFDILLKNIDFCSKSKKKINEEETKMYLIYPFLKYLGYDVFSPCDIIFEYICDMHEKGNRRVDFAIINSGKPLIIIEAKSFGEQLSLHWGQIKSYFVSSGASYAILTDGLEYHIFEKEQIDSNFSNCNPKYYFKITNLSENDYEIIKKLSKLSLKPVISKNDTADSDVFDCEDISIKHFFSITSRDDVIEKITNNLYESYLNFCKQNKYPELSKIAFSRKVNKYYSTCCQTKRIKGEVKRVYVSIK